jgi:Big-like domain-containing protein
MPRSRLFFTAPIVLAVIIIGVFAIRSRGDSNANVDTTPTKNCPPIARADAAATKPGTPISIDVLANDTDPDGDPLVFQIRNTTGGESTIDDGGTPTDAGDDRILFTPADPPPPEATIDYQALDPDGAISESTVTVEINADGALPPGVASEVVPTNGKSPSANGCGTGRVATTTTESTVLDTSQPTAPPATDNFDTFTTTKKTTTGHTTTTRPKPTTTTKAPTTEHTTTTAAHPTTTASTTPPTTGTTQPDTCGEYPRDGTDAEKQAWIDCEKKHNGG